MNKEKAATNVRHRSGAKNTGHSKAAAAKRAQMARKRRSAARRMSNKATRKVSGFTLPSVRLPKGVLAGAAAVFVLLFIIIFAAKGCGVSHKTPERVVKALIESYTEGKEKKVKKCYGVSKADEDLQQEISASIKYFEAFEAEKTEITQCDKIYQDGKNTYVYITYEMVLKDGQRYPCISTYMVQKKDDDKYYVMESSEITDELSKQAAEKYADFMKTQAYKDYTAEYEKFITKNPGYEERLAEKLK